MAEDQYAGPVVAISPEDAFDAVSVAHLTGYALNFRAEHRQFTIESFKTGRGVELGMTVAEVEGLFGSCFKSRQKNGPDLFLEYQIDNADKDPELKEFGYPVYYAEYEFKKGKLIRFRFGFAYP